MRIHHDLPYSLLARIASLRLLLSSLPGSQPFVAVIHDRRHDARADRGLQAIRHKSRIYARLTFAIFNPIMLAMFTRLSISYDYKMISAAQDDLLMVDSMYVYVSNMITVVLLATLCKNCLEDREKRNSEKVVFREIEEFYRVMKSNPHANMKNLAQNIKFMNIGKFSFTSDDSKYLDVHCGHEYAIYQDDLLEDERQDCSICLSVLERGERVIGHPGCNHTFHQVCFLHWLTHGSKVGTCPTCDSNTRIELLTSMMSNRIEGVSHCSTPEIK